MLTDQEIEVGMARLERGFMTPEVCEYDEGGMVEVPDREAPGGGSRYVESEYAEGEGEPLGAGWYARLSASGYMDCTDWSGPFATEREAQAYLVETYGDGCDDEA